MRRRPRTSGRPKDLVALEEVGGDMALFSFTVPRDTALTPAESDVVAHLLAGRSNAGIAAARGTSVRTVANQVAGLFRKLGVASRLELVIGGLDLAATTRSPVEKRRKV